MVEGGSVDDRTARVEGCPLVLGSQQRVLSEPPGSGSWAGRPLYCEQMSRVLSGKRSSILEPISDMFRSCICPDLGGGLGGGLYVTSSGGLVEDCA